MKNNQKLPNILRNQKFYFIFCIQKMYLISAKGYESAGVDLLRGLNENELNTKNKEIYAVNDFMTAVIKRFRGEKKEGKDK